jgi:hypothetical protein
MKTKGPYIKVPHLFSGVIYAMVWREQQAASKAARAVAEQD